LNCPGNDPNQVIPLMNTSFTSVAGAYRVASQLGSHIDPMTMEPIWSPTEGSKFLIVSTGAIPAPNMQGVISINPGAHEIGLDNGNPMSAMLPPPINPVDGSNNGAGGTPFVDCDGVNDCSDTLEGQWNLFMFPSARDLLSFQFEVVVPGGTHGFSFDFVYFSAEFPEYVNTQYNDIFTVWSNSETYTGNLCFVNDQPCTVTALCNSDASCPDLAYCDEFGCANMGAPELDNTGWDVSGGSTGWYNAKASASPGELLQLTWAVFDMGDSIYDTGVILDNWRWDCEGCVPNEVMGCGIEPDPQ
jgi:hypothetical protein